MEKPPVPSTKDKVPEIVPDLMPGPVVVKVAGELRKYRTPTDCPGAPGP